MNMRFASKSQAKYIFKILLTGFGLVHVVEVCQRTSAADPPRKGKSVPAYIASTFDKPKVRGVHTHKSVVRSGPSDQHYATQTLARGAAVEVYMETSDGWSGIRPPSGAHDWIPADVAYLLPGGKTAEIVNDETPSWIGSDSKEVAEYQWATTLKKTQVVHIFGEQSQVNKEGNKQLWYRIAPPQGEFRWVRTNQLSDTFATPEPSTVSTGNAVQLASFVDSNEQPQGSPNSPSDGKMVWSNEREVLSQVEQQIKSEQAEAQRGIATQSNSDEILDDNDIIASEMELTPHTKIRPIPMPFDNKNKAMEHQTDAMRQWDAMQNSSNPKLRVGPLRNVLGLIGISVVEAERAPIHAQIAQSYHANSNQNHLAQVGPLGSGRLDRLPRPTRKYSSGSALPNETFLFDNREIHYPDMDEAPSSSMNTPLGLTPNAPLYRPDSTFSRWLHSREPLFGGSATEGRPSGEFASAPVSSLQAPNTSATGMDLRPNQPSMAQAIIPQQTSAWHAFPPTVRDHVESKLSANSTNMEHAKQGYPDEFQSPEIQSALVSLTQEVASPTEQWDLTSLRRQASNWIENGTTAMVRGEARLLMERIDRFESLRQRTLGWMPSGSYLAQNMSNAPNIASAAMPIASLPLNVTVPANPGVVTASSLETSSTAGSVGLASYVGGQQTGDASGWLVQVHSSVQGQPQFALTDDAGNVVTYVQSTAALNLRRYLQQPVRIYGQRGYLPSLASKQIMAERVQRLR